MLSDREEEAAAVVKRVCDKATQLFGEVLRPSFSSIRACVLYSQEMSNTSAVPAVSRNLLD